MDTEYIPLTQGRVVNGKLEVKCTFDGTEQCQIHNHKCSKCPFMKLILEQLNVFENVYLDKDENPK